MLCPERRHRRLVTRPSVRRDAFECFTSLFLLPNRFSGRLGTATQRACSEVWLSPEVSNLISWVQIPAGAPSYPPALSSSTGPLSGARADETEARSRADAPVHANQRAIVENGTVGAGIRGPAGRIPRVRADTPVVRNRSGDGHHPKAPTAYRVE